MGTAESLAVGTPPNGARTAVMTMVRKAGISGLSVAVVSRDRVLLAGGYGLADRAAARSATATTAYLWFSMTKVVTATAALRLADEGRLDLAAPAGEYVDYLRVPGRVQPSVRELLCHTAGLGNPLPIRWAHAAADEGPDPEALLRRVMERRHAYRYPVGESARYSNVGYLALGQVIAGAAGMPFEAYVQQSVLRPVGMNDTGFAYSTTTADRATGYVKTPRVVDPALCAVLPPGVVGNRHGSYRALNPFYVDGPAYGGLVGNVMDAGRFLRMHLGDGEIDGNRILDPQTARQMRSIVHPGKPFDHGTGWFRRPGSTGDWVEHYGTGVGFWNVIRLYPDRGIGVAIMANSTSAYDFEPLFDVLAGAPWS